MDDLPGWLVLPRHDHRRRRPLARAHRLAEMIDATDQIVWQDPDPSRNRDVWAPEFHRLESQDGPRWFLYYTATDGQDPNHRMYVAESKELMGPYSFKAKLRTDPEDKSFAIDGTVLKMSGANYFVWSGRPSPIGQGLFISRMENPWTLTGPRMYLPADGFGCREVREGPAALYHGARTFLIYSACYAFMPDYKLGMLSIDPNADPMDLKSWRQHPQAVFARTPPPRSTARATIPSSDRPTARRTGSPITPRPARNAPLPIARRGAAVHLEHRRHTQLWQAFAGGCRNQRTLRRNSGQEIAPPDHQPGTKSSTLLVGSRNRGLCL